MRPIFFQRIHFILLSRYKIGTSRKYLSNRTYLCGNMFDTVKYHVIFITENDIAVFSHQLNDQFLVSEIPKIIQMFNFEYKNTLHIRLRDWSNPSISHMLSKQHTEIWCCHRAWFICSGNIYQRQRCTGRQKQTFLTVWTFQSKKQLILLRLCNLAQTCICEIFL